MQQHADAYTRFSASCTAAPLSAAMKAPSAVEHQAPHCVQSRAVTARCTATATTYIYSATLHVATAAPIIRDSDPGRRAEAKGGGRQTAEIRRGTFGTNGIGSDRIGGGPRVPALGRACESQESHEHAGGKASTVDLRERVHACLTT